MMKSINPHRQCLEPLLNQISIDVVQVTAQIASREGGQVAHAINEKCRLRQVVFFGQLAEKRGCWIRSTSLRDANSKQEFRFKINRGVQPVLLGADRHGGFIDRDPRRLRRHQNQRFWLAHESEALVNVGGSGISSAIR